MKALRYALLLVCGSFLLHFSMPARSMIVVIGWNCVHATVNGVDNGVSCSPIWGDDGSGGHIGGDIRSPGGGGGAHTAPNTGDVAVAPRDANVKTDCDSTGDPKTVGDPVVFSTGNRIEPETDFISAGEMGLSLTRTYDYYWNGIGIFGRRWISDYDFKLLYTTADPTSSCYTRPLNSQCDPLNKPIWAQRPDGRQIKFNYSSTPVPGWYEDKPSPLAKIIKTGSSYTLYSEDRTVEIYDGNGFPLTVKNQQGLGWTFSYDGNHYLTRVTQSSGRHVDFGWSNGLLSQITDPAGNVYRYSYATILTPNTQLSVAQEAQLAPGGISPQLIPVDPINDPPPVPPSTPSTPSDPPVLQTLVTILTGAIQPGTSGGAPATSITYQYEDSRFVTALTGKTINGSRYATFQYDANGRASDTQMANGAGHYQLVYTLDGNGAVTGTTITNPLGKESTYQFNARGDQTGMTGLASTHCAASAKAVTYDSNGYPEGSIDFNGNVTAYTYEANGQLHQRVEGAGTAEARTTNFSWDPSYNRATKVTLEGDHETTYSYDANNRLQSVSVKNVSSKVGASNGQTHTTTYSYTTWPNGLMASMVVDGPLAGSGDAVTATYSQAGDLLSVKDALGHTTVYDGYNGLGFPGSVTGPNGEKQSFTYDARGRITDVRTYRNGGTQDTRYEYDGFGRLSRVTQPDGHTHSYQYDVAGRLTSEFEAEAGGTFAQTVYQYNAMSLPTSVKKQRVFVEPQRGTVP